MAVHAAMCRGGVRADNRAALALARLCERAGDADGAARVREARSQPR